MGKEVEKLSVSNKLLLSVAKLSLQEISNRTGFGPIEAGQKITELLEDRNWRTLRQDEQLLIIEFEEMIADAKKRLKNSDDDHYAQIFNGVMRGMNSIAARMDAQRKLIDKDLDQITSADARIFGSAFDLCLSFMGDQIIAMDHVPTRAEMRELKRQGMEVARERLEEFLDDA